MGRLFFLGVILLIGVSTHAQVFGDLGTSHREVLTDCDHKISASGSSGLIFITIVVNRDGEVTSAVLDTERSSISSTILVREAVMRAKKMKFKADYMAPTYHKGIVEFKVVKESAGNEEMKKKNILPENY
ncbi:MAG: hypothetical protein KDC84_09265 [Crocinitomicaceae bacterium]|nr:hypothetical protein [Crocinitomicaceae bacterium]